MRTASEALEEAKPWLTLIQNFRYKPGWAFEVLLNPTWFYPHVYVTSTVIDSRDERSTVVVHCTRELGPFFSEAEALRRLRSVIANVEMHELDEWFRYKNELIYDPHATDRALV